MIALAIRAAQLRLHRSIGQRVRWAHHDLAAMAERMRGEFERPRQ